METQTTNQKHTNQKYPILIMDKILTVGSYFYDSILKSERTKITVLSLVGTALFNSITIHEERGEYSKVLAIMPTTDTEFIALKRNYYCSSSDEEIERTEYFIYVMGKWYKWYRSKDNYGIEEDIEEIKEPDRLLKIYRIRKDSIVSDLKELEEGMVFY